MTTNLAELMEPVTLPPLSWATGKVEQILVQPGERFYVFALRESDGTTLILRIANPHTGLPLAGVASDNVLYDAMKEAYFRDLTIQVGFRDFGLDPQSGSNRLCIDRISLTR